MFYVLDLVGILRKYQPTIFTSLLAYSKMPTLSKSSLEEKLQITSDYPNETNIGDLLNNSKPLCAIITLIEGGSILYRGQYGARGKEKRVNISVDIWTADPMLREYVGAEFYNFFDKNPGLVTGKRSPWTMDMIQSNGHRVAVDEIYRRSYSIWLHEFNLN